MKLDLKNSNWTILIAMCVFGGVVFMPLPFFALRDSAFNPLSIGFAFILCFFVVFAVVKSWSILIKRLSIIDNEIHLTKCFGLKLKERILKRTDVEKIEVTFGVISHGMFHFYLVNKEKITIDLNYITQVEGDLVDVKLSQYAPLHPRIEFILRVAKTISTKLKIPFETSYLDDIKS